MHELVDEAVDETKWMRSIGHGPRYKGPDEGKRGSSAGHVADPTAEIVSGHSAVRRKSWSAEVHLKKAKTELVAALKDLEEGAELADVAGEAHTSFRYLDEKIIKKSELRHAHRAQERRAERGEGFGES